MKRSSTVVLFFMTFALCSLRMSCQDPEELFDDLFTGFYESSDGWTMEVQLQQSGFAGKITKVGSQRGTFQRIALGETVFSQGAYAGSASSLTLGSVYNQGFTTPGYEGTATISGNTLTLTPKGQTPYTFTQTSGSGTGGTTNQNAVSLYNQRVTGAIREKKMIEVTVPAGTKKLTVMTTEVASNSDRNMADLFVRAGTAPEIVHNNTSPYSWKADCSHTAGNRGDKVCTLNNPTSGKWFVIVYGFNDAYSMQLIVTIEK